MRKCIVFTALVLFAYSGTALGSGMAIPEQGAAAMARSASMTARSEDLSAIYYNPAGLDYVENGEFLLGITPIVPAHRYSGAGITEDASFNIFFPPQFYAAKRLDEKMVLGVGLYAPFGLGTEWDEKWVGRYLSTFGEIQTVFLNPTISYQVNELVSVGVGVSYIYSMATIEKMIDTGAMLDPALMANPDFDSKFALNGTASGFGYNLGILVRPFEDLQLGISWRGSSQLTYEGKAKFTHSPLAITASEIDGPSLLPVMMPASQDGKAVLDLPWMLNLGAKYDINDRWDVSGDVNIVGWSVYEELVLDFADDKPVDKEIIEKNWTDSYVFRAATSYNLSRSVQLRAGMLYDLNPVPDNTFEPQLPDSDRIGLSFGIGQTRGPWKLDASYLFLYFTEREKNNNVGYPGGSPIPGYNVANGTYNNHGNLVSFSLSRMF